MKAETRSKIYAFACLLVIIGAQTASAFYNSEIGRWANRDPIGEGAGLNLYTFVENSPIESVDPSGEQILRIPPRPKPPRPLPPKPDPVPKPKPKPKSDPGPIPVPYPFPGGTGNPPKDPKCGGKPGECEFYWAWCDWGNGRPPDDPGKGWDRNAPCSDCYADCKMTGQWPFDKCPIPGSGDPKGRGPAWPPGGTFPGGRPPVWPTPGQY